MRKFELMDILERKDSATTDDLINLLLPKITKDFVFAKLEGQSEDEKNKIYRKLVVYKSRISNGERKEKTLKEVFNFFGYDTVIMTWIKSETTTDQN